MSKTPMAVVGGHSPTPTTRKLVCDWAAVGADPRVIAQELRITIEALNGHYAEELSDGAERGINRVAAALYEKALAGDVAAQTFFLKTRGRRAGWIDKAEDERPNIVVQLDVVRAIQQTVAALKSGKTIDAGPMLPAARRTIEQRPADGPDDGSDLI